MASPRVTQPAPAPRAPAPRTALGFALAALALFAVTLTVPYQQKLYRERHRGQAVLELRLGRGPGRASPGPIVQRPAGEKIALYYEPAGYIYLWVIAVGPDRRVRSLVPKSNGHLARYGLRTATEGGSLELDLPNHSTRTVLIAYLSSVPRRIEDLRRDIETSSATDAPSLAQSLRTPGFGKAFVIDAVESSSVAVQGL